MSQMLLPQGSASAIGEQAASRSAKNRDSGRNEPGGSRYQDVSREHTKKLAQQDRAKKAPAHDPAKPTKADAARALASDNQVAAKKTAQAKDRAAEAAQSTQSAANDAVPAQQPHSAKADTFDDREQTPTQAGDNAELDDAEPVALTFMELQAMLMPAATIPGAAGGSGLPGAGFVGQPLKGSLATGTLRGTAEGTGSGLSASQAAGLALTGALGNSESLRPVEGSNLAADARLDNLLQQPGSAVTRAQAEPSMALRGYTTSVDVPVGQADWGDKVMGKLSWLTARNMSVAEIHLSPADLGPMEVKVRLHDDQASVTVHAANPLVRDQLEQHSHRLRDMLSEQGVALERFDVSDQPRQQSGEQDGQADDNSANGQQGLASGANDLDTVIGAGQLDLNWRGEVDVFA